MEKVRTNQGGIAICVRLRTGGEGVLDFPHFSAYVLCGWPLSLHLNCAGEKRKLSRVGIFLLTLA